MDREEFEYGMGKSYHDIGNFRDMIDGAARWIAISSVAMAPVNYVLTEGNERLVYAGILPTVGVLGARALSQSVHFLVDRFQDDVLQTVFELEEDVEE